VIAFKDRGRPLRIGMLAADSRPLSVQRYIEGVVRYLGDESVEFISVEKGKKALRADVDLFWDPACLGGKAPPLAWKRARCPVVATVHGVATFSLPWREVHETVTSAVRGSIARARHRIRWRRWRGSVHVITVSEFAREDIVQHLPISRSTVTPIYHGVDQKAFSRAEAGAGTVPNKSTSVQLALPERPYLLHVAPHQPKKNVERILKAYRKLSPVSFDLYIHAPNLPLEVQPQDGEWMSRQILTTNDLARLYRGATGFVFPSLHESFGMPILEAMSAGCPVITSTTTACDEIAGDAAVRVDPRSVEAIANAMNDVMTDAALRSDLRQRGYRRVQEFCWETCAAEHLRLFRSVANRSTASSAA